MNKHTHDKRLKRTAKGSLYSIDIDTTIQQYLHPFLCPMYCNTKFRVKQRCRVVFPQFQGHYFGGSTVLRVGNSFPVLPVLQKPLFPAPHPQRPRDVQAKAFYTAFNKTIELNTITRQHRADNISVRFRKRRWGVSEITHPTRPVAKQEFRKLIQRISRKSG